MDRAIEVVMVAAVAIAAASILIFIFQGKSSDASNVFDNLLGDAKCESKQSKYKTAKKAGNTEKADRLKAEIDELGEGCDVPTVSSGSG